MAHGGARPNSGRKRKENNVYFTIRLDTEIIDYIRQRANRESISQGGVVERLIRKEMEGQQ